MKTRIHLMKFARLFLVAVLTVLSSRAMLADGQESGQPFFFIQITDIQFGMHDENKGFAPETALYEKAIAGINRLKPDFVVITGDFVHDPNDKDQINEFKRLTAKIGPGIPVYMIPGNHDVGQVPDKASLRKYRANYGKDSFAFDHKGSRFVGFNTSLVKGEHTSMERQFNWLQRSLKKGKNAHQLIVFGHYPFFIQSFDEPEKYSNIKMEYRSKYLEMFRESGVDAIFSGHLHNNAQGEYKGIRLVTTSAVGKPLGDAPSGFRIVRVYSDRIVHHYYGLDELPDKVVF